jgi:preprotein translocase subunit SecD
MKLSKTLIVILILLIFGAIYVAFPRYHLKFNIPSDNVVVESIVNAGLLEKNKVFDGYYHYDKLIQAPDINAFWGAINSNGKIRLGLDLQGGTYLSLRADMTNVAANERSQKLNDVRKVIENRLNQFGLSETNIYSSVSGEDFKIIVEIPGKGGDVDDKVETLKSTAKLEILVPKDEEAEGISPSILIQIDPTGNTLRNYYIPSGITGADLKTASFGLASASGSTDTVKGQYSVNIVFTDEGAKKFAEMEEKYYQKTTAIMLDNELISAVTIQSKGTIDPQRVITGDFDKNSASNMAIKLRGGALPVPVVVAEQKTIDASLGSDALQKSILAGGVGILFVIIFMILKYRKEGLIASSALILYTLFSVAIFKLFAIHLTLAGFAGFILSIGIAVDANILIFERMREEIQKGKSRKVALSLGFERAWTSIRDSNISTLITCFILYSFGSTVTKGFAINLSIGVLLSMFTAITVTRQMLIIFAQNYSQSDKKI